MIVHCNDTPNDDGVVRMRTPVLTSKLEDGERIFRAWQSSSSGKLQKGGKEER